MLGIFDHINWMLQFQRNKSCRLRGHRAAVGVGVIDGGVSPKQCREKEATVLGSGPVSPTALLMQTPTSSVCGVVDAMNEFTRTAEVLRRKRDGMATL